MKLMIASLFLFVLLVPTLAMSQLNCFAYPGGITSCDGANSSNTTIAPLSRNSGIITQRNSRGSSMEPYNIIGSEPRRSSGIEPLPQLERLPSLDSGRSSSFDRREPVGRGMTPLPRLLGE